MKKNKLPSIFFFSFFLFIFFYAHFKKLRLIKNGKFAIGKLVDTKITKSGIQAIFVFNYKGVIIKQSNNISELGNPKLKKYLLNVNLPVFFEENKFESSIILIFKNDFERYGFKYPDSLQHIEIKKKNLENR